MATASSSQTGHENVEERVIPLIETPLADKERDGCEFLSSTQILIWWPRIIMLLWRSTVLSYMSDH